MVTKFREVQKLGGGKIVLPERNPGGRLYLPNGTLVPEIAHRPKPLRIEDDPRDPRSIGYDLQEYNGLAAISEETQVLDYASGGQDSVDLPKDRVITGIMLVADPYQHDVTTATLVAVQDAVDKVISALSISGKLTYFNLSSTLLFLKGLSAMNKSVYGSSIAHQDLVLGVGADNVSRQAWYIPFGAWNDFDMFDITAGIQAEDETSLILSATFGLDNIIGTVAANGTVDPASNIFVVTYGVQGLGAAYRARLPVPDFRHDHVQSPTSTTSFNLQTGRYLKRSTIVNLAVLASNNEDRNDGNINNISVSFKKPTETKLFDRIRWQVFKSAMSPFSARLPDVDRRGTAITITQPLDGVAVIDWRRLTKNPFGLNLYPFQSGDVVLDLELGTTTGSVHIFHEYYAMPDPSIAEPWPAFRPQ